MNAQNKKSEAVDNAGSRPHARPTTSADNQQYEHIQKCLERDYFIVKKAPVWYCLGGAVTAVTALFGITLITIRTTIQSQAEIRYLRQLTTSADMLYAQIEDEKESAIAARAAVEEILAGTKDLPAEIERLDAALARERRLSDIEEAIAQLARRRDKIKADSSAIVSVAMMSSKAKKVALERALAKNKSYGETIKKIDDLSKELAELKRTS